MCVVIDLVVIGFAILVRYNNLWMRATLSVIFDTDN